MFDEVAKRIKQENRKIVTRWLELLQGSLKIKSSEVFPSEDLLDGVPVLLEGVAAVVENKERIETFEEGGKAYAKAKELGELRESQGFGVDQVINEYIMLKDILWNFCSQQHVFQKLNSSDVLRLAERINLSLDKILLVTIETYMSHHSKTLQYLAMTDDLTKVRNHRFFVEQLKFEVERSRRYNHPTSLLMIDIDYFKPYNDHFGHLQGDEILKRYASIVKDECRASDVVARYGGDEFAVIMPHTSKTNSVQLGQRLCDRIEKLGIRPIIKDKEYHITISCGLASCPDDAATPEELVHKADEALYKAKKEGRNSVVVYQKTKKNPK